MNDSNEHAAAQLRGQMRQTAFSALIAAALMLLFGYWYWGSSFGSDSALLEASATAFNCTLVGGGLAMLLSALLCFAGWRHALLVDAILAGLSGLALMAVGGLQVALTGIANINADLFIIFGLMFIRSAWISWSTHFALAVTSQVMQAEATELPQVDSTAKAEAMRRLLNTKERVAAPEPTKPPTVQPVETPEEPAPSGFLAELGQSDASERT